MSLLIIHDLRDTKVPFRDREAVLNAWPRTTIVRTRGLGHHKILRNLDVVSQAVAFLASAEAIREKSA